MQECLELYCMVFPMNCSTLRGLQELSKNWSLAKLLSDAKRNILVACTGMDRYGTCMCVILRSYCT